MATEMWSPLSARDSGEIAVVEGVPEYLERPLRQWVAEHTAREPQRVKRIMIKLSIRWEPYIGEPDSWEQDDNYDADADACNHLVYGTEPARLFEIADALLSLMPVLPELATYARREWVSPAIEHAEAGRIELSQLLEDARSVYEVRLDGSGLQRRVPEYAARALDDAAAAADVRPGTGSAAAQLRAASDAARALKPNPAYAYSLAIKSVESAAHAVVEPANHKATLGTMIRAMNQNPGAFELAIPGPDSTGNVTPIIAMMMLLWQGQSSRHGAQTPTRDETLEEAMMAVDVATTLVGWFAGGRVRRRP